MRKLLLGTALGLIASAGMAQDVALILGTERYDELGRVTYGALAPSASDYVEDAGFVVFRASNGTARYTQRAIEGFVRRVPDAERVVVVLSGRFVTDGDRTWYMTADADVPEYLGLDDTAISVESIMRVMSRRGGSSVLMLGSRDRDDRVYDAWLTEGVGTLDIPQGVTVLQGDPRNVARFMANELVERGAELNSSVAANAAISAQGFWPNQMVFAGRAAPVGIVVTDPDGQQVTVPNQAAADERIMWNSALTQNTLAGFRNYVNRYPRGTFAADARARIDVILAEPNREARLTEEGMRLSRAQRRGIQRNLTTLGYNTRGVDGIFGRGTRNAMTNWQQQNGYPQTGFINAEQIRRLTEQARQRQEELAAEVARADQEARRAENAFWESTAASGTAQGLQAYLDRYPQGRYVDIATQRLQEATTNRQSEIRAEERSIWDAMREVGDIPAFENYLRLYPNGEFAQRARDRLQQLRAARDRDNGGAAGVASQLEQRERALGLNRLTRRLVETHLQALGMRPGAADGVFDEQTRMGIRRYQNERGLQVTGYLDARTAAMMLSEAQ